MLLLGKQFCLINVEIGQQISFYLHNVSFT